MPRRGRNPLLQISKLKPPAQLTVTTMVHIPELHGYWADSLEVLELCLGSLRRSTPQPFDLIVLDNGSCPEVAAFLYDRFAAREIDQLISSHRNLGKVGGWNLLFAAAGGMLVAYTDSDVYFLPGWLEASQAVLAAFPEAAMVTAQPLPGDLSQHCESTLAAALRDPSIEWREGDDLIPPHFVDSHRRSLGESPEQYAPRIRKRREVRLRRNGTEAYVSASHFQFLTRREIPERFFPMASDRPLGDDRRFDQLLDDGGFWRLSTVDYLVHHMGNRPPDLGRELPWLGPSAVSDEPEPHDPSHPSEGLSWGARILRSERSRRLLKRIHRKSYELLYLD